VTVCSSGTPAAVDPTPDDLTRVVAKVTWNQSGTTKSVVQSTIVPNPGA
jgi:hypothetical protein